MNVSKGINEMNVRFMVSAVFVVHEYVLQIVNWNKFYLTVVLGVGGCIVNK